MNLRSMLPLTAAITPGATAHLRAKPPSVFRPERLIVSPHSFPLPLVRRVWTWPIVTTGQVLARVHRVLAKLLQVDLYAAHERRQYVGVEYTRMHPEEVVSWDEDAEDESEGRPFIWVQAPLNRRERLLALLGRAQRHLSQLRLRWQQKQLSTLRVCNITIAKQSQFGTPMPADLFGPSITPMDFNAPPCIPGHEIEITVHNGNRRKCQLMMTLIGISRD